MAKAKKDTTSRTRNWTFLVYTECTDNNDIKTLAKESQELSKSLENIGIPCAHKLHHMDKLEDGTYKAPHFHVIVSYSSVKTLSQVQADFGHLAANGYIQPVRDMRAACRYLIHKDNPEKAQYTTLPECLNGLDITKHLEDTDKDKSAIKAMKQIITYIRLNNITYYNDLLDMLDQDNGDELYKAAISRRLISPILAYLKARDTQRTRAERAALDILRP